MKSVVASATAFTILAVTCVLAGCGGSAKDTAITAPQGGSIAWDSATYTVGKTAKGFVASEFATLPYPGGTEPVVITTSDGRELSFDHLTLIVNGVVTSHIAVLRAGAGASSYVLSATVHHCWPWHPARTEGDGSPPICTDTATVMTARANVVDLR